MALVIDPMAAKNRDQRRKEDKAEAPPPAPVRTLAEMTSAERAAMEKLYSKGKKR